MRGKAALCFLVLCVLVVIVNADTELVYATNDGQLQRQVSAGEAWATMVAGAGTVGNDNATDPYIVYTVAHATDSNEYTRINRYPVTFNTSVINGGTVTSAIFRVKYYARVVTLGGTNETALVLGSPTNPLDFVAGDYDNYDTTELASRFDFTSPTSNQNINFTLNSDGLAAINTDVTPFTFYLMDGDDIDGTFSGIWAGGTSRQLRIRGVSDATQTNRPYLEIVFTPAAGGDTIPPANIVLTGNTTTCNSINWTWTDSISDDADVVQIYQNGTFFHNVSANQTYDLWEDLAESLEYIFSSHTCDLTGNCNTTWENMTANVASCPPASITNLQNVTTCNSINWTWTNPVDADFNGTMIYKDNVFVHNSTGGTSSLWGTLSELTSYTISTHTFDILGNVNTTWVNQTATTGACGSAPVADFSVNDQTLCIGDTATFTDLSSNTPLTWLWDFGDGNSSVLQHPTHQYDFAGSFDVNLTANNTYGSDSELKAGYITVSDCGVAPTAAFTGTPLCGNVPFNVTFTDSSTGTGPLDFYWDFNDGNTTTTQNPTNTFSTAGTYSIFHYANSSYGLDWENKTSYITAMPVGISCTAAPTVESDSDGGAIGLMYGVIGGILGSMIIVRRIKREELE